MPILCALEEHINQEKPNDTCGNYNLQIQDKGIMGGFNHADNVLFLSFNYGNLYYSSYFLHIKNDA